MFKTLRILILAAITFAATIAFPSVQKLNTDLDQNDRERILTLLGNHGYPNSVTKANDALLVVVLTPTSMRLFGVVTPASRAEEFAKAVDEGLTQGGYPSRVVSFTEKESEAVINIDKDHTRLFQIASEESFPAGPVLDSLRNHGFKPTAIIRARTYGEISVPAWTTEETRSWNTYNASTASGKETAVLRSRLDTVDWSCLAIFVLLMPLAIAAGFSVAGSLATRNDIPLETRRKRYRQIVFRTTFGAMGVHGLAFLTFIATGRLQKTGSLLFGSMGNAMMIVLLLLGVIYIRFLGTGLVKKELILFGNPNATPYAPPVQSNPKSPYLGWLAVLSPFVLIAIALAANGNPRGAIYVLAFGLYAVMTAHPFLERRNIDAESKAAARPQDIAFRNTAQSIAATMGVKPPNIIIDLRSTTYQLSTNAWGTITASGRLIDDMTPDEQKALITREFAGVKLGIAKKALQELRVMPIMVIAFIITLPLEQKIRLPILLCVLALPFYQLFNTSKTIQKRRALESSADQLALETTRDFLSLKSALTKIQESFQYTNEARSQYFTERINRLRQLAETQGIPTESQYF